MAQKRLSTNDKVTIGISGLAMIGMLGFLSYLVISNYVPFRSVGECVQKMEKAKETWQSTKTDTLKILEVGNSHYRMVYLESDYASLVGEETDRTFDVVQSLYEHVQCPGKGGEKEYSR